MPITIERLFLHDAAGQTGVETFAVAFAASWKAAVAAAADTPQPNEIEADIPSADAEDEADDNDAPPMTNASPGVVPCVAALSIAAALVFVWAGL